VLQQAQTEKSEALTRISDLERQLSNAQLSLDEMKRVTLYVGSGSASFLASEI
jgi:chaperonin cofactor prefoldin